MSALGRLDELGAFGLAFLLLAAATVAGLAVALRAGRRARRGPGGRAR